MTLWKSSGRTPLHNITLFVYLFLLWSSLLLCLAQLSLVVLSKLIIPIFGKLILPLEILWNLSLTATKISVLLCYMKVFAVTRIKILAKIIIACVALLGVSGVLCTLLICQPIQFNWCVQTSSCPKLGSGLRKLYLRNWKLFPST